MKNDLRYKDFRGRYIHAGRKEVRGGERVLFLSACWGMRRDVGMVSSEWSLVFYPAGTGVTCPHCKRRGY